MADSMEVHAEEVGQPTDELVVQDPDFDGETEETNAADTGNEADSAGSAPSGDGQNSPQETAPEEKPKRRRAKQPAAKDASEEEGIAEFGTWLEEGACSDGVWLERVCVCWVAAAGCGL